MTIRLRRPLTRLFSTAALTFLPRARPFARPALRNKVVSAEAEYTAGDSITTLKQKSRTDQNNVRKPMNSESHLGIEANNQGSPAGFGGIPGLTPHPSDSRLFLVKSSPSPKHKYAQTLYALRWETRDPTPDQLHKAETFFCRHLPTFLWSAQQFKKIDFGEAPEVAFLGRSNVGKSSLLNALLNKPMAFTSSKPGRTRLMNAFGINQNKLVLLDMPGYGFASRAEWGIQIMKYLRSRKQFRRAFVLIDAKHGLKENDYQFLDMLAYDGIPYQIVFSKVDRVHPEELYHIFKTTREYLTSTRSGASALGEILATAAAPAKKGKKKVGLNELRYSVLVAAGLIGT